MEREMMDVVGVCKMSIGGSGVRVRQLPVGYKLVNFAVYLLTRCLVRLLIEV